MKPATPRKSSRPPEPSTPPAPAVLGRYHLVTELARGGMGVVWLARAEGAFGFEKLAVVKELRPDLAADESYRAMFLEEARLAARLAHPCIVETHDVGADGERLFMALEHLDGSSLHEARRLLASRGGIPLRLGLRVLVAVLDALHHAHELTDDDGRSLGIVHRDVSPQNIFVTCDGRVKLLDFGVAKSRAARRAETQAGVLKGSIAYMSPDHADGSTIDRRADIFAVGILLREMLTGERLWGELDEVAILRKLIARELPPLADSHDSHAPHALRAVCERAMAPRRSDRYATARDMREALDDVLRDLDPRGSLAELGASIEHATAGRRDALRAMLRSHRAGHDTCNAGDAGDALGDLATADTISSSALITDVPDAPDAPPSSPRRTARHPRPRPISGKLLFASLLLVATAATSLALALGPQDRAPSSTSTSASSLWGPTAPLMRSAHEPPPLPPPSAGSAFALRANAGEPSTSASASPVLPPVLLPAAVADEPLPPNPYDPPVAD